MKSLALMWSGLWRKRARTIFTFLSTVVAFMLFGLLQGVDSSLTHLSDIGRLNVLVTVSPAGMDLPLAYLSQIEKIPGVTAVTYRAQLLGYWRSLRNVVIALPVQPASFLGFNTDFVLPAAQTQAFERTRTGVVVMASLARRLNWKVGDQVTIRSLMGPKKDGSPDWVVNIVGIFDAPGNPARDQPLVLMNYDYYDAARATEQGTVTLYTERIADASQASQVGSAIDKLFENSWRPTHTLSERQSVQAAVAQIGDIDVFVHAIVGATFFTLLVLTGNVMLQSFRERTRDFAVMKTIGYTDARIGTLIFGEALILTLSAAVFGLLASRAILPSMTRSAGNTLPALHLSNEVFAAGVGFALVLSLVSAVPTAWSLKRMSVIDALAVG